MTAVYLRANWHTHIGPTVIHIALGASCPGDGCDGLAALEGPR